MPEFKKCTKYTQKNVALISYYSKLTKRGQKKKKSWVMFLHWNYNMVWMIKDETKINLRIIIIYHKYFEQNENWHNLFESSNIKKGEKTLNFPQYFQ